MNRPSSLRSLSSKKTQQLLAHHPELWSQLPDFVRQTILKVKQERDKPKRKFRSISKMVFPLLFTGLISFLQQNGASSIEMQFQPNVNFQILPTERFHNRRRNQQSRNIWYRNEYTLRIENSETGEIIWELERVPEPQVKHILYNILLRKKPDTITVFGGSMPVMEQPFTQFIRQAKELLPYADQGVDAMLKPILQQHQYLEKTSIAKDPQLKILSQILRFSS